jgi:hypothetical protein
VVIHPNIIILDQFQPSALPQIQISLSEYTLDTLVATVHLTLMSDDIMPLDFKTMYHCSYLNNMGGIILFKFPSCINTHPNPRREVSQCISNFFGDA